MKFISSVRGAILAYFCTWWNHKLVCNALRNSSPESQLTPSGKMNNGEVDPANHFWGACAPELQFGGPCEQPHRFWHFEWQHAAKWEVPICCIILFVAGVLCSAGGIGGGGIYVSVLMLGGGLSIHDAVPLSKSIVFFGALSSLALNTRKTFHGPNGPTPLINYNIIRLVVPASLLGTIVGIFLNRILPSLVVLSVLFVILMGMSGLLVVMTYNQFEQEQAALAHASSTHTSTLMKEPRLSECSKHSIQTSELLQSNMMKRDVALSLVLLFVIITCGVIRVHAENCMAAMRNQLQPVPRLDCHHPATFYLGDALEKWMSQASIAKYFGQLLSVFPVALCAILACFYSDLCAIQGWTYSHIFKYQAVALITGILSGLVGIGGGLIFSPFFLLMDIEPSIAVATSSTAVLFTAASTFFQFFFTDRTVVSLMMIYSAVTLVSSYVGTWLIHFLQDKYLTRKSFITGIVACGVLLSTGFTAMKFSPNSGPIH